MQAQNLQSELPNECTLVRDGEGMSSADAVGWPGQEVRSAPADGGRSSLPPSYTMLPPKPPALDVPTFRSPAEPSPEPPVPIREVLGAQRTDELNLTLGELDDVSVVGVPELQRSAEPVNHLIHDGLGAFEDLATRFECLANPGLMTVFEHGSPPEWSSE